MLFIIQINHYTVCNPVVEYSNQPLHSIIRTSQYVYNAFHSSSFPWLILQSDVIIFCHGLILWQGKTRRAWLEAHEVNDKLLGNLKCRWFYSKSSEAELERSLQSEDGNWCARLARSRRADGSTLCRKTFSFCYWCCCFVGSSGTGDALDG